MSVLSKLWTRKSALRLLETSFRNFSSQPFSRVDVANLQPGQVNSVQLSSIKSCFNNARCRWSCGGSNVLFIPNRQFRKSTNGISNLRKKSYASDVKPLSLSTTRANCQSFKADTLRNYLSLMPWRRANRRLELLLNKADDDNSKKLVKDAFTEGYVASGGVTRKFLLFIIALFFVPAVLQLYLNYELISEHFFSGVSEVTPEDINVNFEDVKGMDEVKEELVQIVDFLKKPEKYCKLGGRLPKGVLLVGPPGVGKTLLARAIAGEAGVPFFQTSGSEFEEMFVGLGAKRIRDLFDAARQKAPCVVFIDEIDSVGTRRTDQSLITSSNQTLNQLLSEMDGFESSEGVIVLAATNRKDDLDAALLRPGRFDLQFHIGYPDFNGRKDIIRLYLSQIKASENVDVDTLARETIGFSGADIQNVVNQAALKAAGDDLQSVNMHYLEEAKDLVMLGPTLKSRVPDETTNKMTAYHEAGHALVSFFTKKAHPVHRITILPRRDSLGLTSFMPEKDQYDINRSHLLATIDVMMGGRAAEDLICGLDCVTTGCSSDLERATDIALDMVQRYGMSEKVGLRVVKDVDTPVFGYSKDVSMATAEVIDSEVKRILQESYERAKKILSTNAAAHKRVAEALLQFETLSGADLKNIIEAKDAKEPPVKPKGKGST